MATLAGNPGNVRQQAAAQVKVPKGSSVTITHAASPGTGSGKAPSTKAKAATKVAGPAATQAARQPAAATATFNPMAGYLSTPQLSQVANNITAANLKASLTPLRQQAGQIQNSEGTVASRFNQYGQTGNQILQGLQGNANASALTGENQAAQAAQNTANSIDQTGAAAKALNGGYMDPQVMAALANQGQYSGAVAGSQAALASNLGAGQKGYMQSLTGDAQLGQQEGQANIAAAYAKQLATNRAAQTTLVEKAQPTAKDLATTLGQQQFTDWATEQGLGIKKGTLNATVAKNEAAAQDAQQKNSIAALTAQGKISYDNALIGVDNSKIDVTKQLGLVNAAIKAKGVDATQEKTLLTYQAALAKIAATKTSTALTPGQKTANTIEGYAELYKAEITGGKTPQQAAAVVRLGSLKTQGAGGDAAIELASTGFITPATQAALKAQGVPINPAWIRPAALAPPASLGTPGAPLSAGA